MDIFPTFRIVLASRRVRALAIWFIALALILFAAASRTLAAPPIQVVGSGGVTAEQLAAAAGILVSLALAYVPRLSDWYNALGAPDKAKIMGLALAVIAVGAFGLSCTSVLPVVTCDRDGVIGLFSTLIVALMANQATFLLAVDPFKHERYVHGDPLIPHFN